MNPQERSRKINSTILRAMQGDGKQAALAVSMGVSDSTISRMKPSAVSRSDADGANLKLELADV